jgi:hypothetical protein
MSGPVAFGEKTPAGGKPSCLSKEGQEFYPICARRGRRLLARFPEACSRWKEFLAVPSSVCRPMACRRESPSSRTGRHRLKDEAPKPIYPWVGVPVGRSKLPQVVPPSASAHAKVEHVAQNMPKSFSLFPVTGGVVPPSGRPQD